MSKPADVVAVLAKEIEAAFAWRLRTGGDSALKMLDANDALSAVAELIAASPDMMALFRIKWGNTDPGATAVYERFAAALVACKPATGAEK